MRRRANAKNFMLKQTELGREGNELIAVNDREREREREQARRTNGGEVVFKPGSFLIPAYYQLNMGINLQCYGRRRSWHCHVTDTVDIALIGWCSHNLLNTIQHPLTKEHAKSNGRRRPCRQDLGDACFWRGMIPGCHSSRSLAGVSCETV